MISGRDNGSMNRRTFGKLVAGALGASAIPGAARAMSRFRKPAPVGLQLYTLRSIMNNNDFVPVLRKVAAMGYDGVEFAGYGGLSATEMKSLLDELGIVAAGTHESYENLSADAAAVYEYNLTIGNKNIVCPFMPNQFQQGGVEGYRKFAADLNGFAAKAKDMGLKFLYHNHSFEFEKAPDGKYLMDHFLAVADPDLVKIELDTAWSHRAGVDTPAYIRDNADLVRMLHIKDYSDAEGRTQLPVGEGNVPVEAIIEAGKEIKAGWYIVEQDTVIGEPLVAVEKSLVTMRQLLA